MRNITYTANQGTIGNMAGVSAFQFNNIQNITGGSGSNNFVMNGGSISGSIVGGSSGANTLTVPAGSTGWVINGTNTGNVTGLVAGFSNVQNLTGGTGAKHIYFHR